MCWVANVQNLEQMREISRREQMRETLEACRSILPPVVARGWVCVCVMRRRVSRSPRIVCSAFAS